MQLLEDHPSASQVVFINAAARDYCPGAAINCIEGQGDDLVAVIAIMCIYELLLHVSQLLFQCHCVLIRLPCLALTVIMLVVSVQQKIATKLATNMQAGGAEQEDGSSSSSPPLEEVTDGECVGIEEELDETPPHRSEPPVDLAVQVDLLLPTPDVDHLSLFMGCEAAEDALPTLAESISYHQTAELPSTTGAGPAVRLTLQEVADGKAGLGGMPADEVEDAENTLWLAHPGGHMKVVVRFDGFNPSGE